MEAKPKRNSGHYGRDPEISRRNQEHLRSLIKAEEIIKKLNSHILGKAKMTNTQVRAAEILLRKVSADVAAIQITTEHDQGVPLLKIVRSAVIEHAPDGGTHEAESEPIRDDRQQVGADRQIEHVSASSSKVMPD